ncbi:MAG: CarD family transcriptional regulator [Defluviitaleaceae bacterium]|nr:CarD family transcriptional regulator [Defluviitaleaceae bacterium]
MFTVGDRVVYPLHGAGVIEGLEEKKIDGSTQNYYILRLPIGNLTIMVSVKNAANTGVRPIMEGEELLEAMATVVTRPVVMNENWNLRYKENMDKLRTGIIGEAAEVFRNLRLRERERGLSTVEKKMLSTVKQIIISEIILSHGIDKTEAEELLENVVEGRGATDRALA